MRSRSKVLLFFLIATAGIAFAVHSSRSLPNGPQTIAWDRESCAQCHMLISDQHFAAQLQTTNGEVRNLDDPGCLMLYVARRHPKVHAIYFRDSQSDKWLPSSAAGFIASSATPMGHGRAAVPKNTPAAVPFEEARKGGF